MTTPGLPHDAYTPWNNRQAWRTTMRPLDRQSPPPALEGPCCRTWPLDGVGDQHYISRITRVGCLIHPVIGLRYTCVYEVICRSNWGMPAFDSLHQDPPTSPPRSLCSHCGREKKIEHPSETSPFVSGKIYPPLTRLTTNHFSQ